MIITSSFVTSINNFNLARVAIESWKKKKKKQRDIIFFHFSYPRRTSSFFFSPPLFFVYFRPALCFPISYKSNGIAQSPRTSAFAIAFFLAPSSSFFTAAYPYESRHHRFIYIYTQQRLSVRCARKIPGKNTRRLIEFDEKKFGEERLFIHRGMEDGITKGSLFFPLLFFTRWKRVFISHSR